MSMNTISFEKLRGRENYTVWKRHMKSYLVIKGLWKYTQEDLTTSSSSTDRESDLKALSEIILWIEPGTFSHIDGIENAKGAWETLEKSLSDSGLSRKVALLKQLTHTTLSDFGSMEEYVSELLALSSRVKNTGLELQENIVASLMLAGLPTEYDSFVMTIENTQKTLSVDYVKTTLLQEARLDPKTSDSAMFAKNKKFPCHMCKQTGHFAKNCPQKYKKKTKKVTVKKSAENVLFASLYINSGKESSYWYIDSGATSHMTMNSSLLVNTKKIIGKEVTMADNSKLKVNCAGELKLSLKNGRSSTNATLQDVTYVPNLCANLLSVGRMATNGNKIVFENDFCNIYNKNRELIGTASLVDGLYRLNGQIETNDSIKNEKTMFAGENSEIWHRRLGHICDYNLTNVKIHRREYNFQTN